jgi:hypothetical protein
MKNLKFLAAAIVVAALAMAAGEINAQPAGGNAGNSVKMYTLNSFRHGVNFFPEVRSRHVEYEAGDSLKFDRYHSADVIYAWMKKWSESYPDIFDMYEIGRSFEGRPIYQATVTNRKIGKDTDKPAAFFEGGRHSGEVTSCESVLWLMKYLLENYGKDAEITRIIDTRSIYLRPINNPDGHNLYMKTAQSNRSTVRPVDNDGDGLLDEDAAEDINGDGVILQVRIKDEKNGNMIPDTADPSGRAMKYVMPGKGIYRMAGEGIDSDGDGRINEDGIGGLDLHRNYPENWRPQTESTGRGYTQGGAGEYPLSETETRSVVLFLLSHPNVYVVNSMDTTVPMHLRPPSTSPSEERMYPEDLKWYRLFDEMGKNITGYEKAGDVYQDYGGGNPLFGHGPDFGYWYYGAIWYGDEIWNGGRNKDYNGDGNVSQIEMLKWDDEENDSLGFFEWKPFKHPIYGDVETGGFDPKFYSQNPPSKHLEPWARKQAMFNLEMVRYLPGLQWEDIEFKKTKSYKSDSADYEISVSFRNTGKLPTALRQAQLVKIVRDDQVTISIDSPSTAEGKPVYRFFSQTETQGGRGSRTGTGAPGRTIERKSVTLDVPFTEGGSVTTARFKIRVYGNAEIRGKAGVVSTRGGTLEGKEFTFEGK